MLQDKQLYSWPNTLYFDCNATTPVLPGADKVSLAAMNTLYGNPSSTHSQGLQAKHLIKSARKAVAQVLQIHTDQIIFTSGATEAIHLAVFSMLQACSKQKSPKHTQLLYGATEHKAVLYALQHWTKILNLDYDIIAVPVDSEGQLLLEPLSKALSKAAVLCTMAVNNETGVIHNLDRIEKLILQINPEILWLVDGVQALGKQDLKLQMRPIDFAVFSGHKFYAPKGVGFLYSKTPESVVPLINGGGQERNLRSGTENIPAISALSYVLEQFLAPTHDMIFQPHDTLVRFRNKIATQLKALFPDVVFNTPLNSSSIPTTINFSIPSIRSNLLIDALDAAGLHVSGGSACNAASMNVSYVLNAMGKSKSISSAAIRLSFGVCTTEEEIERCCGILKTCSEAFYNQSLSLIEALPELLQCATGSTNTWIISEKHTRNCIIIDPLFEAIEFVEKHIISFQLKIIAVLDTHSHADHESVAELIKERLAPYCDRAFFQKINALGWPQQHTVQLTLENSEVVPAICFSAGDKDALMLACLPTPGHTEDSLTFLLGTQKSGFLRKNAIYAAFPGDMILAGGIGRTNFPTSNTLSLYNSLKRLHYVINLQTLLCPAHDYTYSFCTHLHAEMQTNSLLKLILEDKDQTHLQTFMQEKLKLDEQLVQFEQLNHGVVCGVTKEKKQESHVVEISTQELSSFLQLEEPLVISILEFVEASLLKKYWAHWGFNEIPRNLPLSFFASFVKELGTQKINNRPILLVCRSGDRSLLAAQSLLRLGFTNIWSLKDGLVLIKHQSLCKITGSRSCSAALN